MSTDGFIDIATKPAAARSVGVPGLGTFAPGVGPAIGDDGTVHLGTVEGKVFALHADGTPYWNRALPSGWRITTTPAVDVDRSVYVVGTREMHDQREHNPRDHRTGAQARTIYQATLYRFTSGGGAPSGNETPFPPNQTVPEVIGPRTVGPPSLWRFGADQAVIVPAVYPTVGGSDFHLIAFSPTGGIMADWKVAYWGGGDVVGGWGSIPGDFLHGALGLGATPPLPGVAVVASPQGGTPWIVANNRYQKEIVGATFCVGSSCSPAPGFFERFRIGYAPPLHSSPAILPDLHTVVGTENGIVFAGPSTPAPAPVTGLAAVYATPSRTVDGRLVVVESSGKKAVWRNGSVESQAPIRGTSIVQAAASATNVFVAAANGLHSFDATAATELQVFPWVGGGIWPPAIGPRGHVYAMASNALFVFPPPH
jgi:hypothetical protein